MIGAFFGVRNQRLSYLRITQHIIFWAITLQFFIYLKSPLLGLNYGQTALVAVKDVTVISIIFYLLSWYIIPNYILKKRILPTLLSLVGIYYLFAFSVYFEFLWLPKFIDIPGRGYQNYIARVLPQGIVGILLLQNVAEILLDLTYLLTPALLIKIIFQLVGLSTKALQLERDNLNLELAFLKAQINPHFLFNTLNNIYSLVLYKRDNAAEAVLKLADLMRYTLYDSNTEQVTLEREVTFFKNYIELEKMRHSNRVRINFVIEGKCDDLPIAPLIIFPFIENAFKHGINASTANSWVTILVTIKESVIHLDLKNSKPLVKGVTNDQAGGIGIANAVKRLNLLYSGKHHLDVKDMEGVFSVELKIQMR